MPVELIAYAWADPLIRRCDAIGRNLDLRCIIALARTRATPDLEEVLEPDALVACRHSAYSTGVHVAIRPAASSVLPALEEPRDKLFAALDRVIAGTDAPLSYLVLGPHASGRRTLLQHVAQRARSTGHTVFELEILPFGHDTPAQVLLRIAALSRDSEQARTLTEIGVRWPERVLAARQILDRLAPRVMVVRFPSGALASGERADRQVQQETLDVVRLVTQPRAGCLHVVAAQSWWQWPHDAAPTERLRVSPSSRAREFLAGPDWGSLAPSAAKLARTLGPDADKVSPLQLRLGVALLAHHASASVVREAIAPGSTLRDLETPLRRMLERKKSLEAALVRVSRARTAVSEPVLRDVAAAGEDWELIVRCFLYPESADRLRFHDQLRWLVGESTPETATHERLRAYYQSLDGATDPAKGLCSVDAWLEKLHHASRADAVGDVDAWLALGPPTREHFWEYGWSLSYVHRRYAHAARVYRELLSRIPDADDNYGQHYYAFNLDRAGSDPVEAERYYRTAVDGDPTNAWWNARYIAFLTERGRFDAALKAWSAALDAIDPGGERSGGDWLPYHLHKHVIQAGLESGNLALADAAHRAIREPAASLEIFRWLRSRIDAASEVHRLGEALFPANVSYQDWWQPRLLRRRHGEAMSEWRAGRVLAVQPDGVAVVVGRRGEGGPVVEHQILARERWDDAAGGKAPHEADFFEVAQIDGEWVLESERPPATSPDKARLENLLRYLSTRPGTS